MHENLKQAALIQEEPEQDDADKLCELAKELRREGGEVARCWGETIRWEEEVAF